MYVSDESFNLSGDDNLLKSDMAICQWKSHLNNTSWKWSVFVEKFKHMNETEMMKKIW